MAGKIIADQIQSTTAGTLDTKYVVDGTTKSWANFSGVTTSNIRSSLNTSSITDQGSGLYWQNFTSNMNTSTYNVIASTQWRGVTNSDAWETGRVYFLTADTVNNTPSDRDYLFTAVWGDLA